MHTQESFTYAHLFNEQRSGGILKREGTRKWTPQQAILWGQMRVTLSVIAVIFLLLAFTLDLLDITVGIIPSTIYIFLLIFTGTILWRFHRIKRVR